MSRSYTSSPQAPPWRVAGLLYFFYLIIHRSKIPNESRLPSDFLLIHLQRQHPNDFHTLNSTRKNCEFKNTESIILIQNTRSNFKTEQFHSP
jgi:hypothetical protein